MRLPWRHSARPVAPRRRTDAVTSGRTGRPLGGLRSHLGRAGIRTVGRTVVAAAVVIGLAHVASPPAHLPTGPSEVRPMSPAQLHLMKRFECSRDGFGDGSTPRSAIIRSERGGLRVVSFDRGWRVYTGQRPQALVAVCLDPPR